MFETGELLAEVVALRIAGLLLLYFFDWCSKLISYRSAHAHVAYKSGSRLRKRNMEGKINGNRCDKMIRGVG